MTKWVPEKLDDDLSKYEAIADAIRNDIAQGRLQPGQPLPTQRWLAKQLSVTVGTVGRAYGLVEKEGLISLEIGRGSFVRSFDTRTHNHDSQTNTIDLGLNLPAATEQTQLMARTMSRIAATSNWNRLFGSAPIESHLHVRQAAARWLEPRMACEIEELVVCSGAQNALVSILATTTNRGDKVLVEELTFPGMLAAAKLLDLELLPIRMDRHGIIPDELDEAASKARVLYTIPTNQNPTTITMPEQRRKQVSRVIKRNELTVIEDDVYGLLIENAPSPLTSLVPDNSFLMSSVAKTLAVGLRLAFVRVPAKFFARMLENMRASNFFPSPILCEIASLWINEGIGNQLLEEQRKICRERQNLAREILAGQTIHGDPQGNHLWLNLPDAWNLQSIESAARENGVNIYTADAFTVAGNTSHNAIRIALGAARNERELRVGLERLQRLLSIEESRSTARY